MSANVGVKTDRKAVLVPKASVDQSREIIRGTADGGGRCYVEPRHLVELGNELATTRKARENLESDIENRLLLILQNCVSPINQGLQTIARLDVIVAKAAFGDRLGGSLPTIRNQGTIMVDQFVYPVLALQNKASAVPTDLRLGNDKTDCKKALIVSGPNGGGKTVAMKSFGVAAVLARMAVPIPQLNSSVQPRVDFFSELIVEVGDQQSIVQGESTFMARLNTYSSMLERVNYIFATHEPTDNDTDDDAGSDTVDTDRADSNPCPSVLVLIDEMGGGTDPAAGGAIAQAILEKLVEPNPGGSVRAVATTHSPRLKAFAYSTDSFESATVLLKAQEGLEYKLPTYQLQYGLIGDSYAMGAVSRSDPPLPRDVVDRAAALIASDQDENDSVDSSASYIQALTVSLEEQVKRATDAREHAEQVLSDGVEIRRTMQSTAKSYLKYFTDIEKKLDEILEGIEKDSDNSKEVVGKTLSQLRLVTKRIETDEETLAKKGMKRLPIDHKFSDGEQLIVTASGPWEGATVTVALSGSNAPSTNSDKILVMPQGSSWNDAFFSPSDTSPQDPVTVVSTTPAMILVNKRDVAVWDWNDSTMWDGIDNGMTSAIETSTSTHVGVPVYGKSESRQKLSSLLSKLDAAAPGNQRAGKKSTTTAKKVVSSAYTSARSRKAATAGGGGKNKKKKNKR